MKQLTGLLFSLLLFFSLCGCTASKDDKVQFYYCRDPELYQYFEADGVIRTETRDLSGHMRDLRYMVSLYLTGPLEEGLKNTFSRSTILISVTQTGSTVEIEISDQSPYLTDAELSLACACLTLTCMDFTPCDSVSITVGPQTITMDADSILLFDSLPQQETTGG